MGSGLALWVREGLAEAEGHRLADGVGLALGLRLPVALAQWLGVVLAESDPVAVTVRLRLGVALSVALAVAAAVLAAGEALAHWLEDALGEGVREAVPQAEADAEGLPDLLSARAPGRCGSSAHRAVRQSSKEGARAAPPPLSARQAGRRAALLPSWLGCQGAAASGPAAGGAVKNKEKNKSHSGRMASVGKRTGGR